MLLEIQPDLILLQLTIQKCMSRPPGIQTRIIKNRTVLTMFSRMKRTGKKGNIMVKVVGSNDYLVKVVNSPNSSMLMSANSL